MTILERLIGLTQTFENLTMARLTHFGKIQPGTANDSNFLSSAQQSDETFTEKYTSLTDKVFDLPPLQIKEATPPLQNEDTFGVPTDMNENKNKVSNHNNRFRLWIKILCLRCCAFV